jgi:hypothetical protein
MGVSVVCLDSEGRIQQHHKWEMWKCCFHVVGKFRPQEREIGWLK